MNQWSAGVPQGSVSHSHAFVCVSARAGPQGSMVGTCHNMETKSHDIFMLVSLQKDTKQHVTML